MPGSVLEAVRAGGVVSAADRVVALVSGGDPGYGEVCRGAYEGAVAAEAGAQ